MLRASLVVVARSPSIIARMRMVGGAGEVVQVEGRAGVRGAAPVGSRDEAAGVEPPHCQGTN